MGLFSRSDEPAPPAQRRDVSPPHHSPSRTSTDSPRRGGSIFSRHKNETHSTRSRSSSPDSMRSRNTFASSRTSGSHGFFNRRDNEDASISGARQRVIDAEVAERDADRALMAAKEAVKDARDHVRALEVEAKEEARLAKMKQRAAGDISKRARPLGKHNRFL